MIKMKEIVVSSVFLSNMVFLLFPFFLSPVIKKKKKEREEKLKATECVCVRVCEGRIVEN